MRSVNDTTPSRHGGTSKWWRFSWRTQTIVAVVCVAAGILFGIASQSARSAPSLLGLDLPQLVGERQKALAAQEEANLNLQKQIDLLIGEESGTASQPGKSPLLTHPVVGPGVSVKLADAPADAGVNSKVDPNALIVHQGDIDAVMNALWSGGAEAMMVQGIRITPFVPVRCVGNVILVGAHTFAPPYIIEAIGDPDALTQALDADPEIMNYKQYADRFGLVWEVETPKELRLPALADGSSLQFVSPLESDDNL